MFVPVVTKDMPLFQTRQSQVRFKNVRSRAQSLGTHINSSINNGHGKVHVSTNCIVAPTNRSQTQRSSQSVGALPTSAAQLASYTVSSNSRSPPKTGSFKKQLDPIVEGVALRCSKNRNDLKKAPNSRIHDKILQSTARKKQCIPKLIKSEENNLMSSTSNNSTPNLNGLKIGNLNGVVSTASSPGLCKPTSSSVNTTLNGLHHCHLNHNGNSSGGIRIVKWLTNTLKGKNKENNKNQDKINGAISNGKCSCGENNVVCSAEDEKSWKSIVMRNDENLPEDEIIDAKLTVQQRLNAVIGSDNGSEDDLDEEEENKSLIKTAIAEKKS